jgi:hypothetical protein
VEKTEAELEGRDPRYAYMVENTRIYEIFWRVLYEYFHGERLGMPTEETQRWLRNTEELFYRDSPPFLAFQMRSDVRPDIRASRRNAYYRMFGMDLNHGIDGGRPYPYVKPITANQGFAATFERFLQEVWRAIVNRTTTSGPNPTDDEALRSLADQLSDMLRARLGTGNSMGTLSREEFWSVATMSWLHLTVHTDTPIVVDLEAQATSTGMRLQKIGERVGLPPHRQSQAFLDLAEDLSLLLIQIENQNYSTIAGAQTLYADPGIREMLQRIITPWSLATGRNIKAVPADVSPATAPARDSITAQGTPVPTRAPSPAASPNGQLAPIQGALVPTRER